MSYARKGHDSDVYIIGTIRDRRVLECCACEFNTERRQYTDEEIRKYRLEWAVHPELGLWHNIHPDPAYTTPEEMLTHLEQHRTAGHKVPEHAIRRIRNPETRQWLNEEDQT